MECSQKFFTNNSKTKTLLQKEFSDSRMHPKTCMQKFYQYNGVLIQKN